MRIPDRVVGKLIHPAWDLYEQSRRLRTMRRMERQQWDGPEVVRERQAAALAGICRHAAARSPFYRDRFREAGVDPAAVRHIDDLAALPLLTKDDVRNESARLIADDHDPARLIEAKTGGSTGVALRVFCDEPGVQRRSGAALLADTWSGWELGQPIAAVWGNPQHPATWKARLRRWARDRYIFLDTMKLDATAVDHFVEQWHLVRPGQLFGHAHSVFLLAEALRGRDHGLRPHGIVTTSMMLLAPERAVIEEVFGVPVTNRYGCEEVSLIACECEVHQGMHLNAEHCWVEFLRADGSPCSPGENGRIVVTEFINRGMPMIRYEVGDYGVPSERICACGRGWPLMDHVTGRVADFLLASDGARVAGISLIENTLTRLPGIHQMQLVQETRDQLRVNLVPGTGYGPDVVQELQRILADALGTSLEVTVVEVERIAQEENGKYRFSICRV